MRFDNDRFENYISENYIEGFPDLINAICESLPEHCKVSIYSSLISSNRFCLISSNSDNELRFVEKNDESKQDADETIISFGAQKFLNTDRLAKHVIFIKISSSIEIARKNFVYFMISEIIGKILKRRQEKLRNKVVNVSYRSNDLNSFSYRIISDLIIPYFSVEASSIYLVDPRNKFLRLSSTSGIETKLEKKDIFYENYSDNYPILKFSSGNHFVIQGEKNSKFINDVDRYNEKISSNRPFSIYYVPIKRLDEHSLPSDKIFGVIKIINPSSYDKKGEMSAFHCIDLIELSYIGEFMSVLTQNYARALEAESNFERTIHGFRADLESGADHIETLGLILFHDYDSESKEDQRFARSSFSDEELLRLFRDSMAFLDDLSFQIEKARQLVHEKGEKIDNFHRDVLSPVIKMQHSMVVANSTKAVDINNFIEDGSLNIPPIRGGTSAYISVFRNLMENSIKYSKINLPPKIRVHFRDGNDDGYFYIEFRDFGIGIDEDDEKYLFVEGFRSTEARRRSFRGTGIGLAYSYDVMQFLGGDLTYERVTQGMNFIVKMPKAILR